MSSDSWGIGKMSDERHEVPKAPPLERVGSITLFDPTRAGFGDAVTSDELTTLASFPRLKTLQFIRPLPSSVWPLVNDFLAIRPDVELRVFGHYSDVCDLGFVRQVTNARRFSADCLLRATNVDAIADMPHLESLGLGIRDLEDFGVLARVPATLTTLRLSATKSKKPRLTVLSRLRSLRCLYLEGQSNGIEVVSELRELEDVTLRSITTADLRYLRPLEALWSLDIKLGGIRSFAGIEDKASIKYLEVWQVRGVVDVNVVEALPGLQNLFLQSLPHVKTLPSLAQSKALRRIVLQNLKTFDDFTALRDAPVLEEFALVEGNPQHPEALLPVLENPSLRNVEAYWGSEQKNREFLRMRERFGKGSWRVLSPFEYR